MWPVSWAITPMTSLGVLACVSVPVLMNTLRPSTTKALKLSCRMMRMEMFCEREAGSPEDGQRVVLQQVLDLGIADQREALGAGWRDGSKRRRKGVDRSHRQGAPSR